MIDLETSSRSSFFSVYLNVGYLPVEMAQARLKWIAVMAYTVVLVEQ